MKKSGKKDKSKKQQAIIKNNLRQIIVFRLFFHQKIKKWQTNYALKHPKRKIIGR